MFEEIKKAFTSRDFRVGGYSIALTAIALAIVIAVNMAASFLPTSWMQVDTTSNQLYSISSQSEKVLAGVSKDVTLYWISQDESKADMLGTLLAEYEGATKYITVTSVDPDKDPTFLSTYNLTSVSNNSVLVVCGDRYRLAAYSDIFQTSYDENYETVYTFSGETEITSAIHYVVSEDLPKAYILTGHGEATLSDTYASAITKDNVETAELTLVSEGSVPEDADLVIINAPSSDISEDELQMLRDYLQAGGNLACISQPITDEALTNFEALLADYGVTFQEGIVMDGDTNYCYYGYPYYLLPELCEHDITSPLIESNYHVLMPLCRGMNIGETSDSVSVTSLLTTSESGYVKLPDAEGKYSSVTQEEGDVTGAFSTAVAITADNGDSTAKLVWFSCGDLLSDEANTAVSGGNEDLFLNSLNWMVGQEENISIRSKTLDEEKLTINSASGSAIAIVLIFVIPLAVLACGIFVVVWRKRK